MNILCIETSAGHGSVALQYGEQVLESVIDTPRAQTEELIARVDDLLARAAIGLQDLAAIGFGSGPGSFIGVRLASAVAQGLAVAAGVGLAPVSSMTVLAARVAGAAGVPVPSARIVVCLDARMGEVYRADYVFEDGVLRAHSGEQLLRPRDVVWPPEGAWIAAGNGFTHYECLAKAAQARGFEFAGADEPRARDMLPLARAMAVAEELVDPAAWHGHYLRDHTAWQTM